MSLALKEIIDICSKKSQEVSTRLRAINDGTIQDIIISSDERKAIWKEILTILQQSNDTEITYLPLRDIEHRIRGKLTAYFGNAKELLFDIEEGKEEGKEEAVIIGNIHQAKQNLIELLGLYNNLSTNIDGSTSSQDFADIIRKLIPKISKDIEVQYNIESDYQIATNKRVIESVIYELYTNYKKYGVQGVVSLELQDNHLLLVFQNIISHKNGEYTSNQGIEIIKKYLEQSGGHIETTTNQNTFISKIYFPLESLY